MAIDRDKLCDAVIDIMHQQGNHVFCLGWDSNHPGGSGANYVNEWNGLYFITSSDYDPEGPFSSLEEALDSDCFGGPTSQPELSSSVLSETELKEIALRYVSEEGDEVRINDERFVLRNGALLCNPELKFDERQEVRTSAVRGEFGMTEVVWSRAERFNGMFYVELEIYDESGYRCENVQARTKHDAEAAADRRMLELQTTAMRR